MALTMYVKLILYVVLNAQGELDKGGRGWFE